MTVTINGTTGITSPEVVLDNAAADGGQVVLKSSGYSNWHWDNYSGRLRAYYNTTEYFTIDTSGNVGIGTSSPSQKLDVTGNIISSQSITIGTGGLYQAGSIYSDSNWGMLFRAKQASPAYADFRWANSADTERMRIDASGNLLVGTTSAQGKVTVNGAVAFNGSVGNYSLDASPIATTYANGATQDFANMSGVIIANSNITGRATLYIMGGGNVTAVGSATGQVGTMAYNAGVAGYRWTNNYGANDTVTFMVFRTRNTA